MATPNPFQRIKLVYRRSSIALKILIIFTILASVTALFALRIAVRNYQQQSQVLQSQAAILQQENETLTQQIAELGTKASIRRIATEELGLVDPNSLFFTPGE